MGFVDYSGGRTFVNIKDGKLVMKMDGVIKEHGGLCGHLTGLDVLDDEFKGETYKKLRLFIEDGDEKYTLDMKLESAYGRAFCQTILNADLSRPMTIVPNMKNVEGKDQRTLFIQQGASAAPGEKQKALKRRFTKDNPEGCPPLGKVRFQGKDHWDSTEQTNFFIKVLLTDVKPRLVHPLMAGSPKAATAPAPKNLTPADCITEPIDDLPF